MPYAQYKRRAKSLVNQKGTCFVVVLLLKQNSLHSAALTQNASAVAICNFNPVDYSRWEGQGGVGLQGGNAAARLRYQPESE